MNLPALVAQVKLSLTRWAKVASAASLRRRTGKSARSSVIWGLVAILVLHLGLLAVYARKWINDPIYSYRASLLKRRVAETTEKPEIVVAFGTSRIGLGFDAKQIEPSIQEGMQHRGVAINFGFAGIGPLAEHIYLRRLLDAGIHPDLVVIEAYVLTLGDQKGIENFALTAERVSSWESHLLRQYGYPRDAVKRKRLEILANPWGELRLPIMSRLYPQSIPPTVIWAQIGKTDPHGWQGTPGKEITEQMRREATAFAIEQNQSMLQGWTAGQNGVAALRDLVVFCRSKGIEAVLVSMPEGPLFRSMYHPNVESEFSRTIGNLSSELAVKWIDARGWFDDENLFYDSHHLTADGATEFTIRFGREIVLPALGARHDAKNE